MEDVSFPRGGLEEKRSSSEAAAEETKQKKGKRKTVQESVKTDFLFGSKTPEKTETIKKRKVSSSSSFSSKHSLLPLGGGGVVLPQQKKGQQAAQPVIEAFGFSKLAKGTKVLAVLREVQDEFAVVSLPNLLTGYVLQDSSKNSLRNCFSVGQTLAVVIQKVSTETLKGGQQQQRRRIQVSAQPHHVNPRGDEAIHRKLPIRGQIVSVEDHGCLVDLGYGRQGFVKFDNIQAKQYTVLDEGEQANDDDDEKKSGVIMQPGRLYDFMVMENTSNNKDTQKQVLSLSLPSLKTLAKITVTPPISKASSPYTLASITPGWLVTAKVEALAKNGVCVSFLGNVFRGAIELSHLGGHFVPNKKHDLINNDDEPWKDIFGKHQHFSARIVAVDVPTKLIRLSLAPHLLDMRATSASYSLPDIGTVVDDCTVVRMDPGIGALLALPPAYNQDIASFSKRITKTDLFQNEKYQEASQVRAVYVHISKALEERDTSGSIFGKDFAFSTTHSVRILSCGNWMDGVASGACAPSILQAHVLTHADLKPGQVYKQVPVCAQLQGGSILVQLGNAGSNSTIRGLIPPIHLFDSTSNSSEYRRKLLQAKYAVDAKIDVRVLWVDVIKKKCLVSTKKSLVKADESEIITSYDDIQVGQKATGFISKMDDKALYVTFCNRVYGKVTARSLASELGIEDHTENYRVGDVVTCRVLKLKQRDTKRKSPFDDEEEELAEDEEEATTTKPRAYWEVTLSLKVQDADGEEDMQEDNDKIDLRNPRQVRVQAGAILPLKSMKIIELVKGKPKEKGGFVPGYAIVSIKSKHLVDEAESANMLAHMECKLPYDQLMDEYSPDDIKSVEALDQLAERVLTVGKKINQKGIILTDPRKSNVDYSSGIGTLAVVSIRKILIETAEEQYSKEDSKPDDIILPAPDTHLFVGALVQGFVAQVDERHGAFIRFLDGMTGLVPRKSGGLNLSLYETIVTRVRVIDDTKRPFRILLEKVKGNKPDLEPLPFKPGDKIDAAKVTEVEFFKASLKILNQELESENIHALIHCTMKESAEKKVKPRKTKNAENSKEQRISKGHPFYGLEVGQTLAELTVVSVMRRKGSVYVQLTDRSMDESGETEATVAPTFVKQRAQLKPGMIASGIVTGVAAQNGGLYVQVSPFVKGFVPGLELSHDLTVLNDIAAQALVGLRIKFCVMDEREWHANRAKCPFASQNQQSWVDRKSKQAKNPQLILSVIACEEESTTISKPSRGDLVVARINKSFRQILPPSLMVALRGGYVGRCCITELDEVDEWVNMPLGRMPESGHTKQETKDKADDDEDSMEVDGNGESDDEDSEEDEKEENEIEETFPNGQYVKCRVLKAIPKQSVVDISFRTSREKGSLDDDESPKAGDTVQGYVIGTNKKGCFVRLARHVEGRSTLKELCDGFLPNPEASFPMGRLVVGKVKEVRAAPKKSKNSKDPVKIQVDLDMRESTLLENKKKLTFDDIELQGKYKGTVTRIETYGVFVQIENSNVSGLTHLSECSDKFVKNLQALYDPGDLVKILVIKKENEGKKLGFSMKASHFENDEDSDDDSSASDSSQDDQEMKDVEDIMKDDDKDDDLDSDDENFASKLAAKMQKADDSSDDDSDDDSEQDDGEKQQDSSDDDSDQDDSDDESDKKKGKSALDTDVGFDWGGLGAKQANEKDDDDSSEDSDSEDDDDDDEGKSSSHKSRKKQAQRRREEQEISRREMALADGTADENPETAGDFERLLAGNPNSSELWIRYMAFYLSLADIPSARAVADKALGRIEFRQEREKLNVWTALLTLEHKYGNDGSLQATVDRACSNNNPKQVYLRVCEILEKDLSSSPGSVKRANEMFAKMCKKFKSKKKVWLAHLQYLLKQSRHQEAHALLKRALLSLAPYKHAETMSKFAQLEFEFGSPERARTVFDGILLKYPKRLDLFFVYLDKEIKFGSVDTARTLLERKVEERKWSDKQMKSLFKKWYRIEDQHGTEESREHVKDSARNYVQQSNK